MVRCKLPEFDYCHCGEFKRESSGLSQLCAKDEQKQATNDLVRALLSIYICLTVNLRSAQVHSGL